MVKKSDDVLKGMAEIKAYYPYSEATIIRLIHDRGFPAKKPNGHIWESSKRKIDKWRSEYLETAS